MMLSVHRNNEEVNGESHVRSGRKKTGLVF